MLKRIVVLAFLCAAFLLLLGLMVKPTAQQAPLPRAYPQRALLPSAPEQPQAEQQQESGCELDTNPVESYALPSSATRFLPLTVPHHRQFYFAFHYSDEAG